MTLPRPRGGLIAAALVLALAVGCGSEEPSGGQPSGAKTETKTVKFGYIGDYNGASALAVADDQKLWEKHGLEAETKKFTAGPIEVQALGAGDIDFGYLGPGALWLPASGKAKIVAINTVGLADRVIAQPGITSVQQLKGKRVGVPEGTSGDMILQIALEQAGMKVSDVEKVAMDPPTIVSAFSSGKIDAAGMWFPLIGTIKRRVPDLVEVASSRDFYPDTTFPTAFVARNEVVEQDPELVKRVLSVLQEANDWRAANREAAVQATSGFIGAPAEQLAEEAKHIKTFTSAELVRQTEDGTVADWLTGLEERFVTLGTLPEPVDPKTFYAGDLYVAASQQK